MTEPAWTHKPRPARRSDVPVLGRWNPAGAADVTTGRMQLSAALHDGARPSGAAAGAVERLLMVFEELVSNAVRHGQPPIEVMVTATGHHWLLEVTDADLLRRTLISGLGPAKAYGCGLMTLARSPIPRPA